MPPIAELVPELVNESSAVAPAPAFTPTSTATGLGWDNILDHAGQPATVLIVDEVDLNRRLLKALLKSAAYRILEVKRASEALSILECEKVDLVIIDQMMPEMSGTEFCQLVKSHRHTQLIPLLVTTSIQGVDNAVAGFESGADEFLIKPLVPALVRTRVRSMLKRKALTDSLEESETILFALAQAVEHRDKHTGLHCERLAAYGTALAEAMGLSLSDQQAVFRGGYLHDIGKITTPDAILFKPGPLNEEEWRIMRLHTVRGEEICRPMKTLAPVLPIIRSHHERWDGGGYPDGLRGENIPLLPRVLQAADIYDALTSARPYKVAFSPERALEVMLDEARRGWRDPELIDLFVDVARRAVAGGDALWAGAGDIPTSLANMRRELAK